MEEGLIGLIRRKANIKPKSKQLDPSHPHPLFEVRGESGYSYTAIIVAADDGQEACQLAKDASLTLLSGRILKVEVFIGASSTQKGLLSKYDWRKDKPTGETHEILERKKL